MWTAARVPATERPAMNDTADTESVLREGLNRWKAAVDALQPQQVAALFT